MKQLFIVISFFVAIGSYAYAQAVSQEEIVFEFRLNETSVDADYSNNREQLEKVPGLLELLALYNENTKDKKLKLKYQGAASPEGPREINQNLAKKRLKALQDFMPDYFDIAESDIYLSEEYIPWTWLANKVKDSNLKNKQEILDIISEEETNVPYGKGRTIDNRVLKLMRHAGGATWKYLQKNVFNEMRFASVSLTLEYPEPDTLTEQLTEPEEIQQQITEEVKLADEPQDTIIFVEPVILNSEPIKEENFNFIPWFYIKTNAVALSLAQSSIGIEADITSHWSAQVHCDYSAWNYFKSTVKFRTTDIRPSIRYWFNPNNQGWFIGAHFGLTWYNYAFNGRYRYQDHDRRTPAIGGGVDGGYRLALGEMQRWHVEFGLSAGAYKLDYDKFLNEPNGRLVGREQKTYIGIDGVFINFSYRFALKKNVADK